MQVRAIEGNRRNRPSPQSLSGFLSQALEKRRSPRSRPTPERKRYGRPTSASAMPAATTTAAMETTATETTATETTATETTATETTATETTATETTVETTAREI